MNIVLTLAVCVLLIGITFAYPYSESEVYEDGPRPRYVRFVPLRRMSRNVGPPYRGRVMAPRPVPVEDGDDLISVASSNEPLAAETGYGHSHQPYDYVDYGAYTGGYGAFGWYSDHPVYTQHHGGY